MRTFFIVNPTAGRREGPWQAFDKIWKSREGSVIRLTQKRGHAPELAREALRSGFDRVIAVGGDGTLSETVNGVLSLGRPPRGFVVGHFPSGSGCDFARHFKIPSKPADWPGLLESADARRIDIGKVTWTGGDSPGERYFVNIAMAGIAGDIAHVMETTGKPLGGTASYLAVSLAHLLKNQAKSIQLSLNGNIRPAAPYHLLAVANTATTGGGMRIAPGADASDGLLDFVAVQGMSRAQLLWNFPKIYAGTHLTAVGVENSRVATLGASCQGLVRLNIDGEPLGALPAQFEILPSALPFLLP